MLSLYGLSKYLFESDRIQVNPISPSIQIQEFCLAMGRFSGLNVSIDRISNRASLSIKSVDEYTTSVNKDLLDASVGTVV